MKKSKKFIKIYHLIGKLDDTNGGPAKSVPYLVRDLNKLNVKGHIFSVSSKENEVNDLVEKYNLDWTSFPNTFLKDSEYSIALKDYLINLIKNEKNIMLHTHSLWKFISFMSYRLSKKYQIPLILSLRGSIELNKFKKKIVWQLYQKKFFQASSVIHVTNKEDIFKLRNLKITSPIALIPNGIDLDQFKFIKSKNDSKKKLGLNIDKKYILFLSRIHEGKGLKYLVHAWSKIANHFTNWDLLIVGPIYDKKYFNEINQHINKFNLSKRVKFTGMLRGNIKNHCYSASDLFVLPSYSENFGIAVAEALAAKLPVITTKGTPWQEIDQYNAGWWVKLNQTQIDKALKEALSCKKVELQKKGINGHKLIQKYDSKSQSEKMKKVYDWILGNTIKPEFIY